MIFELVYPLVKLDKFKIFRDDSEKNCKNGSLKIRFSMEEHVEMELKNISKLKKCEALYSLEFKYGTEHQEDHKTLKNELTHRCIHEGKAILKTKYFVRSSKTVE